MTARRQAQTRRAQPETLNGRRGKNHVENQWSLNLELRSAEMIALICSADAGCESRPVVADRGHGEARDASLLGYMHIAYLRVAARAEPSRGT